MTERVVIVTGASSGIGRATARLLAQSGYCVFGTSRQPDTVTLDGIELVALDVTNDESVARCIDTVVARAGRLDALVNNAGTSLPGAVEEVDMEAAHWLMETNFFGPARVIRAALPHLRASGGHIVNVSSGLGLAGMPFEAYYSASKHALEGLTEALRQEVAPFGVRVALVEPGFFRTDIRNGNPPQTLEMPIYRQARRVATEAFDRWVEDGGDPLDVARTIRRALEADRPRMRYAVGPDVNALALGKRLAPYPLFVRGFRVILGLDPWQETARQVMLPMLALAAGLLTLARARRR